MHSPRPRRLLPRPMRQTPLHLQHHAGHLVADRDLPPRDAVSGGSVCAGDFDLLGARGGVGAGGVGFVGVVALEALH